MENLPGLNSSHVLVVDHDRARLLRNCSWLLDAGCNVSTRANPEQLASAVRELRPDAVLVDVMPVVGVTDWRMFLEQCRLSGDPIVISHSQLSAEVLRTAIECRFILRVLRPTEDRDDFLRQFETLIWFAHAKRPRRTQSGTQRAAVPEAARRYDVKRDVG